MEVFQPEKKESLLDKIIRNIFRDRNTLEQRVSQSVSYMNEGGSAMSECELARYIIGKDNSAMLLKKDFAMLKDEIVRMVKKAKEEIEKSSNEKRRLSINVGRGEKIVTDKMKKEAKINEENEKLIETGFDPEDVRKEL